MPDSRNLEKLKKILEIANEDTISKKEVMEFFKALTKVIQDERESVTQLKTELTKSLTETEVSLVGKTQDATEKLEKILQKKEQSLAKLIKGNENLFRSETRTITRLLEDEIRRVESLIPELSFLEDNIEEVKTLIREIPEQLNAEDVRNELETLEGDERLKIEAIRNLREELEELEKRITTRTGGGGVTDIRIRQAFKNILLTEEPVGLINGSNKTYTVSQAIFAVMAFSINGEVITQLPNYTIANKTITFSTALPAVYSGKDFECKYLG